MTNEPQARKRGVPSLEELSVAECMDYLASAQVGRVAVVVDGHPAIFPVNYILDGDQILYRTRGGYRPVESRPDPRRVRDRPPRRDIPTGMECARARTGRRYWRTP